jgi:hypothetical protein
MSEQRRIDLLFTATVRAFGLARTLRRAGPALAMVLVTVIAVHGMLGGSLAPQVPRLAMDMPPGWTAAYAVRSPSAHSAPPGAGREVAAVEELAGPPRIYGGSPAVAARAVPVLDREQMNIARFISKRYRVTVDATSEFVYHAYRAARDFKLDPMLVLAVMSVESSFNPKAQSSAGAQGLMQVLTRVHADRFRPFGGIPAAFDPVANIRVGSAILKEYLQREGTIEGALKSYVGAALLEHDGGYGMKVLNARERIAAAAAGRPIPPDPVVARVRAPEASPAPAAPAMLPVSTIVETRAPLPPAEEPRAAAPGPERRDAEVHVQTLPVAQPPAIRGAAI